MPPDKEKVKEREKDEGKEVDGNRAADPEEVGLFMMCSLSAN